MKLTTSGLLILSISFAGCEATHDVASTSFHVVTAPVRFVHHHIFGEDDEEPPPPAANQSGTADVVTTPGQPIAAATPTPPRRSMTSTKPRPSTTTTTKPSPPRTASTAQTEFPTAQPVPGRPGLVYNPFDPNGGYIDVSGYAPGSKVKDPDSKKIFIVP